MSLYHIKMICALITAFFAAVSAQITTFALIGTWYNFEFAGFATAFGLVTGYFILPYYVMKSTKKRFDRFSFFGAFLTYWLTSFLTYISLLLEAKGITDFFSRILEEIHLLPLMLIWHVLPTFPYSLPSAVLGAFLCRLLWVQKHRNT